MDEKKRVARDLFDLQTEAGYPGFRREYFDDPAAIREWPDPAVRERELRANWQQLREEQWPDFERAFAPVSGHELMRQADQVREALKTPGPGFYDRACQAGRAMREPDPLDRMRDRAQWASNGPDRGPER